MRRIKVIDSHTGGEPTRLVIAGGPDLGSGPLSEQKDRFRDCFDDFRRSVILEPRGSDVHVGALLCDPVSEDCSAGVIFFNNTGYLNMCGHGTIGLAVSLAYLNRITAGLHRIDTPVGIVEAELIDNQTARIRNVPGYRYRKDVLIDVPQMGPVVGEIAWGGNWFFLTEQPNLRFAADNVDQLLEVSQRIKAALLSQQITGADGEEIDHIELYQHVTPADSETEVAGSAVNFVLCPGGAWDRSPCGTGTSAKLACLAADGRLQPGEVWQQTSVIGSSFLGTYQLCEGEESAAHGSPVVIPSITGSAWISAESTLIVSDSDPFAEGISTIAQDAASKHG